MHCTLFNQYDFDGRCRDLTIYGGKSSKCTFDIAEHGVEAGVDGGDALARRERAQRRGGLRGLRAPRAHRAALRALLAAASVAVHKTL